MVAASTLVGLLIAPRWGNAPIVLLYLPAVLGAAVLYGLWPALFAAVASTLAYDFFFTEPYHALLIYSPADLVTVLVLFLVALVTSQLAGSMRGRPSSQLPMPVATPRSPVSRAGCCRARASRTLPAWRCVNCPGCSAATRCL
jgi:hypothetical protein